MAHLSYTGTVLPAAAETVAFLDTSLIPGGTSVLSWYKWFNCSAANDAAGTVNFYYSTDGVTWHLIEAVAWADGSAAANVKSFFIEGLPYVKVEFVDGGSGQGSFAPELWLSDARATDVSEFAPSSLGGSLLSLYGDRGVTLSGSDVTAWADQGPSGNNATSAGSHPSIVLGDSDFNGHNSVQFDVASTEYLNVAGIGAALSGDDKPYHLFVVGKLTDVLAIRTILGLGNSAGTNYWRFRFTTSGVAWQLQRWDGVGTTTSQQGGADATTAHIIEFSGPGTTGDVLEDGAGTTGQAMNGSPFSLNQASLGSTAESAVRAAHFHGKMAHVELFDRKLSAGEALIVREWFQARYGTPALP